MGKSKVKKTGQGFVIEGVLDFQNNKMEVEDLGEYPLDNMLKPFDGKLIAPSPGRCRAR
jgi:hypothetical protein